MNTIRRNQNSVKIYLALIIIIAAFCLISPNTAEAAIAVDNTDSLAQQGGTSITISSFLISGTNRLMLVGVSLNPYDNNNFVTGITWNTSETLLKVRSDNYTDDARTEIWYLKNPTATTAAVVVSFNSTLDRSAIAGVVTFTGVEQTTTFRDDNGTNWASQQNPSITVTTAVGDMVFGVVSVEDQNITATDADTEHWRTNLHDGFTSGAGGTKAGEASSTSIGWTFSAADYSCISAVAIQPVAGPTTTIGDGTSPANKDVAPDSTNNAVDAFTLVTDTGTDTVTALTVTFSGTAVADVAASGVKIYEDSGSTPNEWDATDTLKGTASFSGDTASITVSISVTTTSTQYLVTYDIATGATACNTLQGAITAATVTNTLANNDTNDATLTVSSGSAAAPSFVDSVESINNTASMTLTVTMPTNIADDMIYVIIGATAGSTNPAGTFAVPDGSWTEIFDDNISAASAVRLGVFRKKSTGSESASYDWTISISSGFVAIAASYRGAAEIPDIVSTFNTGSGLAPSSPTVTTTVSDTMVLRVFGADDDDATDPGSYPGCYTGRNIHESGSNGNGLSIGLADVTQAGAEATGAAAWTLALSEEWGAVTIAIAPSSGTTTTIGDGTSPANKNVASSSTNNAVDAFTLATDSGNDTVTALTVTLTGTVADVAASGVKIYEDNGSTPNEWDATDNLKGTASFSGLTASITVSISVNTTATQYLVTYDIAAGATVSNTLLGAITDATVTLTLVNNDTTDATLTIVTATTTIGDGTSPANKNVALSSTNNAVDAFTLTTNSGNDTVDALTVTFAGTAVADVATSGVKIYEDNGSTPNEWDATDNLKGTASFSGTTASITVSISVNTTSTQYLVTYDIAAGATVSNTLQGAITAATVTNTLVNNDTTDATLTIVTTTTTIGDGTSPGNKSVVPDSTNNAVDAFTLVTDTGSDTVDALTVTFSGTAVADVAASGVKIYEDNGSTPNEWDATDTLKGTASFSGDTASITVSISVTTTSTQYLVTYDIAAGATAPNLLQGAITAATVTNALVNNDTTDAFLTVASRGISYVRSGFADGATLSFDIGTAGTDRLVVVIAGDESRDTYLTAVTVDGKSCTLVQAANNTQDSTGNHQEMWYADEDNLGASNGVVTIAITGGGAGWGTHAHLYTGVYQGGPTDSGKNETQTSNPSVTVTGIDVSADGLVVMGGCHSSTSGGADTWTSPLVERTDDPIPSTAVLASASGIESSAQTNKSYTVTFSGNPARLTGIVASWDAACASRFSYRKAITIQASQVSDLSGDLSNFPVLISLTGDWLKTTTADSTNGRIENDPYGYDIIFRDSTGTTQLNHEIEKYDGSASGGTLVAWVKIPLLDYDDNTVIYMYYGNSCIDTSTQNVAGVWDTDYLGVWHLKETPTVDSYAYDSALNNDGTFANMTSGDQMAGQVDGSLDFDASNDYIQTPSSELKTENNFTLSAWFKTNSLTYGSLILWQGQSTGNGWGAEDEMQIAIGEFSGVNNRLSFFLGTEEPSSGGVISFGVDFTDTNWNYVAVTVTNLNTSPSATMYLNGGSVGTDTGTTALTARTNWDTNLRLGRPGVVERLFDGKLDEVRISKIPRNSGWIQTEYSNQKQIATFYIVGGEETPAATAVDLISFTATGQSSTVLVEWETAQEIRNLGFNLYRSSDPDGSYTKLNSSLIPGLISSVHGQQYTYADMNVTRSVLYYYMLEDVDLFGTRTMHGPVCVDWDGDGTPDDNIEDPDDDTDEDTGEEDPEVSIPDTEFDELESGLTDWTPSSSSASWVKMASFRARQEDGGVALEWETSSEVDILGFHVYREVDGKFYRITADLVPGSVFKVGAGRELPAGQSYGQSYVYWDGLSEGTGYELYWLDSVELNGGRASFGPIRPEIYGQPVPKRIKARFRLIAKHQVSRARAFGKVRELREELSTKPIQTQSSKATFRTIDPEKPSEPRLPPGEEQWALAAQSGVKIYIKEDGWYRVGEPELVTAGLRPGVDPRYLQLYADGEEQCLMVTGSDDGRFDPDDAIEFYGTGLDTPFTDAHVYWLVVGSRPGRRLDTPFIDIRLDLGKRMRLPRGLRGLGAPLSFPYSVELKERTFYFGALTNGEKENFFGSIISTEPVNQLLTVPHPDPSPPEKALLEVVLQGATDFTHQIKIMFNFVDVGEVVFSGQERAAVEIQVPHDLLLEGDNIVTLTAQGGSMDVSLVDYLRLTYWRTYTADEDVLQFKASGGEWLSIGGFSSSKIQVVDITDPIRMFNVRGKVRDQDTGYAITIKVPSAGERTLLAFTEDKIKRPAGIAANLISSWHELSQGAEVMIIGHRDLFESVRFLKELREQQGWSVVLVDVEDLYDEFNFGAKSPWALKDFLAQAYAYWNPQPRFVVLVGDASYDPRNYLGYGDFDLVPTKFVDTEYLKTASDDWFVDFNDNGLPEMAVGRLPVENAEEAAAVVSKIISYDAIAGLMKEVLLVADANDKFDFEAASGEVRSLLPQDMTVREIFRGQSSTARSDLLAGLNQGQLLVNYIGHGSTKIWKGNLLTSLDAWNLSNSPNLPFLVSMTCLNGFFQDPYIESMAETFMKAEQGGAVAVWTSSGLTDPGGQVLMNRELVRLLFNGVGLTIGEAVIGAKQAVTNLDIRRTWILFGDPTLKLR